MNKMHSYLVQSLDFLQLFSKLLFDRMVCMRNVCILAIFRKLKVIQFYFLIYSLNEKYKQHAAVVLFENRDEL